jgi:hypothetical protein
MTATPDATEAKRKIGEAARDMLSGALSFIEGARLINQLRWAAKLGEFDLDILPFVAIDCETDALPFGHVRQHWAPDALAKLQPEIERSEQWAREFGQPYCQKLIDRFG